MNTETSTAADQSATPSRAQNALETLKSKPHYWGIPAGLLAIFSLITRIFAINPAIVPDERIYSLYSRHLPMSEASIPDYLFYWVFNSTNLCGPNFYTCGKAINLLFFVGAALIVYLIAIRGLPSWGAWLVAVATLASPLGYYASFFMPEMMFFFATMVVIYFLVRLEPNSGWKDWAALGLVLGIASLTKPHALFLGIAIAFLAVYFKFSDKHSVSWMKAILNVASAGLASVFSKFLLGFIFAGVNGLTLFGGSYSSSLIDAATQKQLKADEAVEAAQGIEVTARNSSNGFEIFFEQIFGHIAANALMYSAALALGFLAFRSSQKGSYVRKVFVVVASVMISGVLTIALFSVVVSAAQSDHSERIMVRYYDYLIPLSYIVLIVSSYALFRGDKKKSGVWNVIAIAIPSTLAVVALSTKLSPFKPAFYDGTSLQGILNSPALGWSILIVGVIAGIGFTLNKTLAFGLVAFIALPLLSVGATASAAQSLELSKSRDRFDFAAEFTRGYLQPDELDALTVVSYENYPLSRTLMQIDNPGTDFRKIEKGQTVDADSLEQGKDWVLLIGDTYINKPSCLRHLGTGYQLLKLCRYQNEFYFNQPPGMGKLVESTDGVGVLENWGVWTVGSKTILHFTNPLPANAKIKMTIAAAPFLDQQQFVASVGTSAIGFAVTEEPIDGEFEFNNSGGEKALEIEIPSPKSPKAAGQGFDPRNLGLQLYKITISK